MKVVTAESYGGPQVLQIENVKKPSPKSNEVLIKIN
ncbi:MAG: NADPH:quinone reductase-like Zn-dependent oxidoreductase, partial [Maribacter sp.]